MMTELTLTAAGAGFMRLTTGVEKVSEETICLCVDFVAHYIAKAVGTSIIISGPLDQDYYDKVITVINFRALSFQEE
jgi:hypothetical protein